MHVRTFASSEQVMTHAERIHRLVTQHQGEITRFLARIGVPASEVDDVAQEVFLVASAKLPEIADGGDRPFLYAIAARVAQNARRARARRTRAYERYLADASEATAPTPEELSDELRGRMLVDSVLREMPRELRSVLVMCEVDEIPIPEIAQRLSLPTGTATSRLRRARETFSERARRLRAARTGAGVHVDEGPEILSWWVSDGEVDALRALIDMYRRANPGASVVHGGIRDTAAAKSSLSSRMASGSPPDTFQTNGGQDLLAWARREAGGLESLEFLFQEEGWRAAFPKEVLELVTKGGEAFAVPLNIHRTNTMIYDRSAFARAGVELPRTLDDLHRAAAELRRHGTTPIAIGARQPWMLSLLLFENLLVAIAGASFYRALFEGRGAPRSPELRAAVEELGRLLDVAAPESASLSWDGAVERVRIGAAAMTFGGDWAKGYLECRGTMEGESFGAEATPGTGGTLVFTTDTFGLPRGARHREGTIELLRVFGSTEGQRVFNRIKGSQPARGDVGSPRKSSLPPAPSSREVERVPTLTSLVPPSFSSAMDAALETYARDRSVDAVLDVVDREYVRLAG